MSQLRALFLQVFGQETASQNAAWLRKKLAEPPDAVHGQRRSAAVRARDQGAAIWSQQGPQHAVQQEQEQGPQQEQQPQQGGTSLATVGDSPPGPGAAALGGVGDASVEQQQHVQVDEVAAQSMERDGAANCTPPSCSGTLAGCSCLIAHTAPAVCCTLHDTTTKCCKSTAFAPHSFLFFIIVFPQAAPSNKQHWQQAPLTHHHRACQG